MEIEKAYSSTNIAAEHKALLTNLYSLTQHVLNNSRSLDYMNTVFFDEQQTKNLLTIIEETNNLKKKRVTEDQIARLAYVKEPSLFEQPNQSFFEQVEQFVSSNNSISNYHIAIFFKRLETYNNRLNKNDFITPTLEQYKNYADNKNIEIRFTKVVKKAKEFGILLDETIINRDQPPFTPINMNIATEELDTFINDIKTMCNKKTLHIKTLAELLYLNNHTNATEKKDR
jgi:hypothetical protein